LSADAPQLCSAPGTSHSRKVVQRFGFGEIISVQTAGNHLSPGQRRVAEALRALVEDVEVIAFDEPPSSPVGSPATR
jgi:ABC-type sugar transport system ATPase subunit